MTTSHIQFAPLILPRKTPAEELRELTNKVCVSSNEQIEDRLNEIAARLEAPDAPKRWDGVWPWSRFTLGGDCPAVYFGDKLAFYPAAGNVQTIPLAIQDSDKSYHDGVIITITAGSGDEAVKVMRGNLSHALYLSLGEWCVRIRGVGVGEVKRNENMFWSPLPPGTVTRITINHTLPTTEQRYSVEVVEHEQPKFTPITVANERVKVGVESAKIRMDYLTLGGSQVFNADEAREIRDAISAALEFGNPTQEQPATEAVAERLPLEIKCGSTLGDVLNVMNGPYGNVVFQVNDSRTVIASPADEARLRNLLNQRAEGGEG